MLRASPRYKRAVIGSHETTYANSDAKLREKITSTEALCDELMEENESLKAEVRDLQQEIEEMQDQYREEEIEEFRELQRELEQNAKNCRILQFKLRKAERIKEETDAEKLQLQSKLNVSLFAKLLQ
uniref:Shootin-1 n=1 Tax=Angiostrongylus cantonensis TaxID=6313 RepID=A0A0K0D0M7_ANGCA